MEEETAYDGYLSNAGQLVRNDDTVSIDCVSSDVAGMQYSTDFTEKSLCYIFNHTKYDSKLELDDRPYADVDCNTIKECFASRNFDVHVFTDETRSEIMHELEVVSRERDHTNRAAFVCFFMTHGEDKMLYAYDSLYPVKDVFEYFSHYKCPSLNGKPKLFFIQACRGDKGNSGVAVMQKQYVDGVEDSCHWTKIPGLSDFLIGYSTVKDYVSFKNKNGSIFMQSLCKYINMYAPDMDLLQIMTYVNHGVAQFQSRSSKVEYDKKKQMPCVWFTLTKFFKFSHRLPEYF